MIAPIKLPSTPEEVVAFIGTNFGSIDVEGPPEDRCIRLTVHDLLSSFQDLADAATQPGAPAGCGSCPKQTAYGPAMCGKCMEASTPPESVDTPELGRLLALLEDANATGSANYQSKTWLDVIAHIDADKARAVAAERERAARLALQWGNARNPENGGNALYNFAQALSGGAQVDDDSTQDYHWGKAPAVPPKENAAPQQHAALSDEQIEEFCEKWLKADPLASDALRKFYASHQPAAAPDFSEQYTQGYTVGHAEGYASCTRRMAVDERASFEAWIIAAFDECGEDEPNLGLDKNGRYTNDMRVLTGWQIWQARANLAASSPAQPEVKP